MRRFFPAGILLLAILDCSNETTAAEKGREAAAAFEARNFTLAASLARESLNASPTVQVRFVLAKSLLFGGDRAGALHEFERLVSDEPGNIRALYWLAEAQAGAKNQEEALRTLGELLRLDPDHIDSWLLKGAIHESRQEHGDALKAYQNAVRQERALARAFSRLASFYRRANLGPKALQIEQKAQLLRRGLPGDQIHNADQDIEK